MPTHSSSVLTTLHLSFSFLKHAKVLSSAKLLLSLFPQPRTISLWLSVGLLLLML